MTSTPRPLQFYLGAEQVTVEDVDPNTTLLQYLRGPARRTGTKEGCAEGDCGACTVVVREWRDGQLESRTVNACIQLLPLLDGKQVVTVEDLSKGRDALHPVQEALVEQDGSQCGFCTPGFVMSLYGLCGGPQPSQRELEDAIAGNLCRCTGYGPILAAGHEALAKNPEDPVLVPEAMDAGSLSYVSGNRRFFSPRRLDDLMQVLGQFPDALIVAGLTDVGLWVTKHHRRFDTIVSLNEIEALKQIEEKDGWLEIGAGVTYSQAEGHLTRHWPHLGELLRRLGSRQIRNAGTIGGNIANGSPIGDSPPPLIVLEARLLLLGPAGEREIPLEDFFIEYGRQDLRPGEIVAGVRIPLPSSAERFACYKISKRFDQDISALCGAFNMVLDDDGRVEKIRIAYGGMAGVPKRAEEAERSLLGQPWNEETVRKAMSAMDQDYEPMSDLRASAAYRRLAARNLLMRFFLESQNQVATQVLASAQGVER